MLWRNTPVNRNRLFSRIPLPRASSYGITVDDILRISTCPELVVDLLDCLHSDEELDLLFGLMFAEHLHSLPDFCRLAEPSLQALTMAIRAALGHTSSRVRADAVRALVAYRSSFEDYSTVIRSVLSSPDAQSRREALVAAPTFLAPRELSILLSFRGDPEVSETLCMGGPLRYHNRDLALSIAERIAGRQFSAGDCSERVHGSIISWRSWSAFTHWLDSSEH